MIWVDETYINYLPDAVSLEPSVRSLPELVVCKSMSKCYALSGLRVAYAVSQNMATLRRYIPPWAVSLPGQLAAVAALRNEAYYQAVRGHPPAAEAMQQALDDLGFQCVFRRGQLPVDLPASGVGLLVHPFHRSLQRHKGCSCETLKTWAFCLPNNAVRFAVRSPEENEKMLSIVDAVLAS